MSIEVVNLIGISSLILGINFTKKPKSKKSEFELESEEYASNLKPLDQLERLRRLKEPPQTILEILDAIALDFLKRKFHIRKSTEYSDLIEFFSDKNKPQIIDFCRRMNEALYSGQDLTAANIEDLISDLQAIMIKEDPAHNGYENKKDPKLYSLIDKISLFEGKEEKSQKEEYLSKKTKEFISSKLSKKRNAVEKQSIEVPLENISPMPKITSENNAALGLMSQEDSLAEAEPEEDKLIESIDDLDRIREKIQNRKKAPAEANKEMSN